MKSYSKPTSDQIAATLPMLSSPQHEAYFFSKLNNPHWVEPLRQRRVFDHPPKSEAIESGGFRYLHWPPSKFLARMAVHIPKEVGVIFAKMKTDNVSIVGEMLKAALAMPADTAFTLEPAISQAARRHQLGLVYFTDAANLCVHLANGGESSAAIALADALFEPKFDRDDDHPHGRDEFWYETELAKLLPVLIVRQPREFLLKLCNWLSTSVAARPHVDPATGSDYSHIWRPAIEEHAQNPSHGIASALVDSVREGFEHAVRDGLITIQAAFEILERFGYLIFKRIRLHLINEFAEAVPELARQTMMDRSKFDDPEYKHEYAMLVGHPASEVVVDPCDADTPARSLDRPIDRDARRSRRRGRRSTVGVEAPCSAGREVSPAWHPRSAPAASPPPARPMPDGG